MLSDLVARTAQYFRTRAARADPQACLAVLERMQQAARPVIEGDELSPEGMCLSHVFLSKGWRSNLPVAATGATGCGRCCVWRRAEPNGCLASRHRRLLQKGCDGRLRGIKWWGNMKSCDTGLFAC